MLERPEIKPWNGNKQTKEWEETFQNHIPNKKLLSKIHKNLLQPINNNKKTTTNYLVKN